MNNPKKAAEKCEQLIAGSKEEISSGDYSAMVTIINSLLSYLEEYQVGGRAYVAEKLIGVRSHIDAMFGSGPNNGHSYQAHFNWAYGDIGVAKRNLKGDDD